jgi:hypothetical protein
MRILFLDNLIPNGLKLSKKVNICPYEKNAIKSIRVIFPARSVFRNINNTIKKTTSMSITEKRIGRIALFTLASPIFTPNNDKAG